MIKTKIRNQQVISELGARLKQLRTERRITQEELAEKAGISLSQVARIESGKLNTTISTMDALAKALEVNIVHLVSTV